MRTPVLAPILGAAAAILLAATGVAHADPTLCKAAIARSSANFVQRKASVLYNCERKIVAGKLPPSTDCHSDPKVVAAIARAEARLRGVIPLWCGGVDLVCGTPDGDDTLASIGWTSGVCPNFENGSCTNAIGNCNDIADCLLCIDEAAVDQAISLYYDAFVPSASSSQVNRCQRQIGRSIVSFLSSKSRALARCWNSVNLGVASDPCPVPGDGKAAIAIAKAEAQKQTNICRACGGPDALCDGNGDLTPAAIGFVSSCPAVAVPGGNSCAGPVNTLNDLVACVDCVTEFKVDCVDRAAVPWSSQVYPAECNSGALPVPTRTATPVVAATPTPTPTVTATLPGPTPSATVAATNTATPTPTATATPLACGNGLNDPGEKCDASAPAAGWATCGPDFTCVGCNCACPTKIAFTGDASDPASVLDTGWTGISHRAPIISDGTASVSLSCPGGGTSRPCGVCTVSGPVANGPGKLANQRCTDDTSIHCTDNTPCLAGGGTCQFFFGANLPLAAGGVTVCAVNQFNGPVSGTANVETGDAFTVANLTARVYTGIAIDNPCARCVGDPTNNDGVLGGTCDGGTRIGLTCDGNGTVFNRPDFGTTSLDCPLGAGVLIATLPIDLTNATATVTKTVSASSPQCSGSATERCLCDTCNNLNQEPCGSNAVCPDPAGPIGPICGGRRCLGGTNAGAACTIAAQCSGGTNSGAACTVASQCPGGGCANSRCVGGTNDLGACVVASACPGGVCNAFCTGDGLCNRPGAATAPSACLDNPGTVNILDCVDGGSGEGTCTQGPVDANCTVASGHAQRGCASAADCGGGVGSCASPNRNCFLTGGFTGSRLGTNTLIAAGMADVPMADTANPTLGAVFCVGPTGAAAVNSVSGLPGPGRTTIKGTAVGKP